MPKKIFINQPVRIVCRTKTDLSTATALQIRYKKPDDTIGYLTAMLTAAGSRDIGAVLPGTEVDQAGEWEFRSWVTFAFDVSPIPGVPCKIVVFPVDEE